MVGIEEEKIDFPPGEYIGTAKLVQTGDKKIALETKPEAKPESKPEAKLELKPEPKLENGANAEEEIKPALLDSNLEKIKLNFIAKDPGITDGVGVLTMNDESQRFFWRSEGNNLDTWNVLFTKDNNLYSNIQNAFKFDGIVTQSEIENKIEGRLYFDYDTVITQYFVEASQIFKPKIIPAKEGISIKGGDSFDIQVEKAGEDQELLEVILSRAATDKLEALTESLTIKQMATEKGLAKITLATVKGLAKGDYSVKLIRSKDYTSNSVAVTVN